MNQKGIIKFCHQYYKLARHTFTTIRGKSQFRRYRVGDVVTVEAPKGSFKAEITGLKLQKPVDMSLEFIQADAEYPGFTLNSVDEFITLLNSFRAPAWKKASQDEEMTVFYLKKI
jgi:hypothetical protein